MKDPNCTRRLSTYHLKYIHTSGGTSSLVVMGGDFRQTNSVLITNTWLSDGTSPMTGRNFISAVHIKYNCLYNKSCAFHGRDVDQHCSRGSNLPETLNHISKQCFSTLGLRIKRHDALSNYVKRSLTQRGYSVHSEPIFKVNNTKLKPDLVSYSPYRNRCIGDQ